MPDEDRLHVRSPEFARVAERTTHVTTLTSRLDVLPFDAVAERAAGRGLRQAAPGLATDFGEHVFANQGCTFLDLGGIRLGDGDLIGPKTTLVSSDHPTAASERSAFITRAAVTVEAGAWLGAAVTVPPGVTVGRGAVVGAGAVVTEDVPPDTLVTGPAAAARRRWQDRA